MYCYGFASFRMRFCHMYGVPAALAIAAVLRWRLRFGTPEVEILVLYGTTLKVLGIHLHKINILTIGNQQNRPFLARIGRNMGQQSSSGSFRPSSISVPRLCCGSF